MNNTSQIHQRIEVPRQTYALNLEGELGGYRQQQLTGTEISARTSACVEKLELQLMDCWRLSVDKIENLKLSVWAGRHSLRELPALLCVLAPGALLGSQRDQRKLCSASMGGWGWGTALLKNIQGILFLTRPFLNEYIL